MNTNDIIIALLIVANISQIIIMLCNDSERNDLKAEIKKLKKDLENVKRAV